MTTGPSAAGEPSGGPAAPGHQAVAGGPAPDTRAVADGGPAPDTRAVADGGAVAAGILVRAATPADTAAVAAIYAPVVDGTAISFEEAAPSPDEISRRMLASPRLPWLVADDAGQVAGYAYASTHRQRPAYRWSADCSIYLDPRYRGRGLGRLLYEQLIGDVRDLGYHSLFAGIALPNPASVGLHEALGFQPVGIFRNVGYKLGSWRDVGWWQRPLREPPAAPAEPRPWDPAG